MKKLLLLSTLGVMPVVATPSLAATCNLAGLTYTCSGGGAGGGFTNNTAGLTVNVEAGAYVSRGNGDGIRVRGDDVMVTNDGTISGETPIADGGSDGLDGGHGLAVINNGTIQGTNKGIDAEEKNFLTVENHGTISGYDKAIRNADGEGAYLLNGIGALIESQIDEGFESGNSAYVENYGTIRASDDAIQVGENAEIHNYGLIESLQRGGDEADPQDGIDIDSGSIYNYAGATIRSDDDAAVDYDGSSIASFIFNEGLISGTIGVLVEKGLTGDVPNVASQTILNQGTIEGRSGIAMDLGAGDDALFNDTLGVILGDVLLGEGDDAAMLAYFGRSFGLFDGGLGDDVLTFGVDFAELSVLSLKGGILSLALSGDMFLTATGFETFVFGDGSYSYEQIAALAPVPLPAAGLLIIGGLGALTALRRRC